MWFSNLKSYAHVALCADIVLLRTAQHSHAPARGSGGMLLRKIVKITCSEIASECISDDKSVHNS